jgi:hypothetical protein
MHPDSSRAFQEYLECGKRHYGLGNLNMTNKTNYLHIFIYINISVVYVIGLNVN